MSKIAGLSELQLIYKFLDEYEHINSAIFKDGLQYAVVTTDHNGVTEYWNGATISDAIRKFYEAQESELESDKP
jgi:diphthamide synthase (EF-2-diphthine--ammonia ligase)